MYLAVTNVQSAPNYHLILTFSNGEKRQFDMKPYLNEGIFTELKDISNFNRVRISFDTIEWENGADFDPEVLYKQSIAIEPDIACEPIAKYGIDK